MNKIVIAIATSVFAIVGCHSESVVEPTVDSGISTVKVSKPDSVKEVVDAGVKLITSSDEDCSLNTVFMWDMHILNPDNSRYSRVWGMSYPQKHEFVQSRLTQEISQNMDNSCKEKLLIESMEHMCADIEYVQSLLNSLPNDWKASKKDSQKYLECLRYYRKINPVDPESSKDMKEDYKFYTTPIQRLK